MSASWYDTRPVCKSVPKGEQTKKRPMEFFPRKDIRFYSGSLIRPNMSMNLRIHWDLTAICTLKMDAI